MEAAAELVRRRDAAGVGRGGRHVGEAVGRQPGQGHRALARQRAEVLDLGGAQHERQQRPEGDDPVGAGEPAVGQRPQHGLAPAQRRLDPVAADEQEWDGGGVGADGVPHPLAHRGHPLGPRGAGPEVVEVDRGQDPLDDQALQLLPAADVAVERHGADAELAGDGPHRQPLQAPALDHRQRRLRDGRGRERAGPGHALQSVQPRLRYP